MKPYIKYVAVLTLIASVTACSSDDTLAPDTGNNYITLHTSVDGALEESRSATISAVSGIGSVHLSGWFYPDSVGFANTAPSSFFFNEEVTVDNSGNAATSYCWPGNTDKLAFFAYGPKDITSHGLSVSSTASTKGAMQLSYTVPEYASQMDLVAGSSTKGINANANSSVAIPLKHLLTQVRFVVGSGGKSVTWKSITISGVHNTGTYTMDGTWSNQSGSASYTVTPNVTSGTSGAVIVGNSTPLLLLPQTLGSGVTISVTFSDSHGDVTRSLTPTTKTWAEGTIVTYSLAVTSRYDVVLGGGGVDSWSSSSSDITM